jgi:hypothetical protein
MTTRTNLGSVGRPLAIHRSPLPAARPFANHGAHGVTRPTQMLILTGALVLLMNLLFCGCVTKAEAGARERAAYQAGQKAALASVGVGQGVTVIGAVEHPNVPWVEGLTLAQAIATANYTSHRNPKAITISRNTGTNSETINVPPRQLIGGHVVPLQPGDTIKIE